MEMATRTLVLLALSSFVVAAPSSPSVWSVGQEVETTSGKVKGHEAPWPAKSEVSEYLGIRYAQAPVGPLRFAAPQAYKSKDSINADKWVLDVD
jgi:hypothetical protein